MTSGVRFATLEDSLMAAAAWFDRIDMPLSSATTRRFCWRYENADGLPPLAAVDAALESLAAAGRLERDANYYCLPGRQGISLVKMEKSVFMERKALKALRFARLMAWVPGVRGIALCNDAGIFQAGVKSDVDLFVVARHGSLWFVRLCAVLAVPLTFNRRNAPGAVDPLCLSFLMSDANFDVSRVALPEGDPYLAYWCQALYPLLDDGCFENFYEANVGFVRNYFAGWERVIPHPRFVAKVRATARWALPAFVESFARNIQMRFLRGRSFLTEALPGASQVVNDEMLKFHADDRRAAIRDGWKDAIQRVVPSETEWSRGTGHGDRLSYPSASVGTTNENIHD